jgi:hypothetical protein
VVVKQSWFQKLFAPKVALQTRVDMLEAMVGLNAKHGGARPNAGRKSKSQKVNEDEKEKINKMMAVRRDIMFALHTDDLRDAFIESLRKDIISDKPHIRDKAQKILARIFLEMPVPKDIEGQKDGVMKVEDLLQLWEDKQANDESGEAGSTPATGEGTKEDDISEELQS